MRRIENSTKCGQPREIAAFRTPRSDAEGNRSINGEPINAELKQHAVGANDWRYREHVRVLHEWAGTFNREFDLGLQIPAIRLDPIPIRDLGSYQPGRNGFGVRHEITLNTRHLDRPLAEQLETLLHEMLHEWQSLYGKPGRGNYHNREFCQKARLYGLIVNQRGHLLGIEMGRFKILLGQHGVDTATLRIPEEEPVLRARMRRGDSKLKKWSCGCTNVRCAVPLAARCERCGNLFEEAEPAW